MMNNDILFSIIMPAYNAEKYIREAVDSVIKQSYSTWELLIVDDGSTDETVKIIESEYKNDPRVILIKQEHKGTAGAARNTAIEVLKGEYVQILDSDDYLSPDCLESYVKQLEKQSEKPDLIIPVAYAVDNNQNISIRWECPQNCSEISGLKAFEYSLNWKIHAWICIESSLIKRIRYEEKIVNGDEFTSRKLFFNAKKVIFTNGIYYYRLNQNSTTRAANNFVKMFDIQITDYNLYNYAKTNNLPFRLQKRCAFKFRNTLVGNAYSYIIHRNNLTKDEDEHITNLLADGCKQLCPIMYFGNKFGLLLLFCLKNYKILILEIRIFLKLKAIIASIFGNKTLKKIRADEKKCKKEIKALYVDKGVTTNKKTAVVMFDGKIAAGGLCDRLRGVISIYQSCKEQNVNFKLNFCSPFNLTEFMEPNEYDWTITKEDLSYDKKSRPVFIDSIQGNEEEARKQKLFVKKLLETNFNQLHFYTNAHYSLYSSSYSVDFKKLFKPSARIQNELNLYLDRIGTKDYVSASFRFLQLLGDFDEKYKDFYEILPVSEKSLYIQKGLQFLKDLYEKEKKTIFVATDSKSFLKAASEFPFVFTVDGEINHVDAVNINSFEANKKTFIDFYMIANASKVYLGHMGKMHYSGFPRNAALLSGKEFEIVEY